MAGLLPSEIDITGEDVSRSVHFEPADESFGLTVGNEVRVVDEQAEAETNAAYEALFGEVEVEATSLDPVKKTTAVELLTRIGEGVAEGAEELRERLTSFLSTAQDLENARRETKANSEERKHDNKMSEVVQNPFLSTEEKLDQGETIANDQAIAVTEALNGADTDLDAEAVEAIADMQRAVAPNFVENTVAGIKTERFIQSMASEKIQDIMSDENLGTLAVDLVEAFTPILEGFGLSGVAKQLGVAGQNRAIDTVLIGNTLDSITNHINNLQGQKKIDAAQVVLDASTELGLFGRENALLALEPLIAIAEGTTDVSITKQTFYNAFGILDALPIIGGILKLRRADSVLKAVNARKVIKKATPDGVAGVAEKADPAKMVGEVADASENPEKLARLGTTTEEVANTALGTTILTDVIANPNVSAALRKSLEAVRTREAEILTDTPNPVQFLQPLERLEAQRKLYTSASGKADLHIHSMRLGSKDVEDALKSVDELEGTTQGVDVAVTYGKSEGTGFASLGEADDARKALDDWADKTDVVVFDPETREMETITRLSDIPDGGEFYLSTRLNYKYNAVDDADAVVFGDKGGFRDGTLNGTNGVTAFFIDNGNRFQKWIMDASNVAEDTSNVLIRQYNDLIKPFSHLNFKGKKMVADALQRGTMFKNADGTVGRTFQYEELIDLYPNMTNKEITGYYAARSAADLMYSGINQVHKDRMVREGQRWVSNMDETVNLIAKPLSVKPSIRDVDMVVDLQTGKGIKLTQEAIDTVYANGGQIGRVRGGHKVGPDEVVDYVLLHPNHVKVKELPHHVIKYREGYFPRMYKENYFLREVRQVRRNGVLKKIDDAGAVSRARAAFQSKPEAEKAMAQLLADSAEDVAEGKVKFEVTLDKKKGLDNEGQLDILASQGRLFTSARGEHLHGLDNSDLANVEDPITAIMNGYQALSHMITKDNHIAAMTSRFMQHYGTDLVDPIDVSKGLKASASFEGKEMYDFIQLMKGVKDPSEQVMRTYMSKLANWMDDRGLHGMFGSQGALRYADANPGQALRSTSFALFIAFNMAKQFMLQAGQFTMLSLISPKDTIRSVVLGQALIAGGAVGRNTRAFKGAAKMAGMEVEEFDSLLKAYKASGIPDSLNKHAILQHAAFDTKRQLSEGALGNAARVAGNMVRAPIKGAQTIGFNAGELENLTMTWALAHRMWVRTNPGKKWVGDRDVQADWGATARAFSFNATKVGSAKMQRGVFSTSTQFWAFQMKAWEAITISEQFTRGQKARMAAAVGILWGAAGYGTISVGVFEKIEYEIGETVPEGVRQYLMHGLADTMLNSTLTALMGEDEAGRKAEVAFAEGFSPLGGIDLPIEAIFSTDRTVLEALTGVSYHALSRIGRTIKLMGDLMTEPDLTTSETLLQTVKHGAEILPFYSNIVVAQYMHDTGYAISGGQYDLVAQVSAGEILARGAIGLRSRKEMEVWDGRAKSSDVRHALVETGRQYARRLNQIALEYKSLPEEALRRKLLAEKAILAGKSPHALYLINTTANKYLIDQGMAGETSFIMRLLRDTTRYVDFEDMAAVRNDIKTSALLTEEERKTALRVIELEETLRSEEE